MDSHCTGKKITEDEWKWVESCSSPKPPNDSFFLIPRIGFFLISYLLERLHEDWSKIILLVKEPLQRKWTPRCDWAELFISWVSVRQQARFRISLPELTFVLQRLRAQSFNGWRNKEGGYLSYSPWLLWVSMSFRLLFHSVSFCKSISEIIERNLIVKRISPSGFIGNKIKNLIA